MQEDKTIQTNGKTFAFALFFFPKKLRRDIADIYQFFRILDDIVDNHKDASAEIRATLHAIQQQLHQSHSNIDYVIRVIDIIKKYHIPLEYFDVFINTMLEDLSVHEWKTKQDLHTYEFGVAGVVGLCLAYILSLDQRSYKYAEMLGNAMQYTNILRDIYEDAQRGRVYIPEETYVSFGLRKEDFSIHMKTSQLQQMYQACIEENKAMYKEVRKGFGYISPFSIRLGVVLAAVLYERILYHIEKNRNQSIRARVPFIEKVLFIPYAIYISITLR